MNIKNILPTVLFLVIIISAHGQRSNNIKNAELDTFSLPDPHLLRLGLTPSSILNEYIGIQGNGAANLSDRIQFNLEFGWIFYSTIRLESDINGFRLRPAFRFYIKKTHKYQFHFSAGYNYRKTSSNRNAIFDFSGNLISANYAFKQERTLRGISYIIGFDFFANKNLIIDIGLGTGLGHLRVQDRDTPEGGSRFFLGSEGPRNKYDRPNDYQMAMFIVNFKVQYLLY